MMTAIDCTQARGASTRRRGLSALALVPLLLVAIPSLAFVQEEDVKDIPRSERGWLAFGYHLEDYEDSESTGKILIVHKILPGGPSSAAGLLPGDAITHIEGEIVDFTSELEAIEFFARIRPGQEVDVLVRRPEGEVQLKLTAGDMPQEIFDAWKKIYEAVQKRHRLE